MAEISALYLTKGCLVYVEGALHGCTWKAEDGTTNRSAEVVAETLKVLPRGLLTAKGAGERVA